MRYSEPTLREKSGRLLTEFPNYFKPFDCPVKPFSLLPLK